MALLKNIRTQVVSALTNGRPTTDFPYPDLLIDDYVLKTAASVQEQDNQKRKQTDISGESDLITRFTCVPIKESSPVCTGGRNFEFSASLSFEARNIVRVSFAESGFPISQIEPSMVGISRFLGDGPSEQWPHYYWEGRTLYFIGGNRDFDQCSINISAIVSGVNADGSTTCVDEDITVPVKSYLVEEVIRRSVEYFLQIDSQGQEDVQEDGNFE